eukprot:IDg12081t1
MPVPIRYVLPRSDVDSQDFRCHHLHCQSFLKVFCRCPLFLLKPLPTAGEHRGQHSNKHHISYRSAHPSYPPVPRPYRRIGICVHCTACLSLRRRIGTRATPSASSCASFRNQCTSAHSRTTVPVLLCAASLNSNRDTFARCNCRSSFCSSSSSRFAPGLVPYNAIADAGSKSPAPPELFPVSENRITKLGLRTLMQDWIAEDLRGEELFEAFLESMHPSILFKDKCLASLILHRNLRVLLLNRAADVRKGACSGSSVTRAPGTSRHSDNHGHRVATKYNRDSEKYSGAIGHHGTTTPKVIADISTTVRSRLAKALNTFTMFSAAKHLASALITRHFRLWITLSRLLRRRSTRTRQNQVENELSALRL